ncbi:hypothetical protein [Streptomyces sp. NPDC058613]|uniref:hypothetical protein n=2 Tax=Streptomyces TaxID=1883 RepID=UPI00364F30DD
MNATRPTARAAANPARPAPPPSTPLPTPEPASGALVETAAGRYGPVAGVRGGAGPAPSAVPDRPGGRRVAPHGTGRRAGGHGPGGRRGHAACVRGRFRLSEVPGVTVGPVPGAGSAAVAATAAYRALGSAGLGHLGGRLELRTTGSAPRSSDLARAARRAVAAALAGPQRG